MDQLCNLPGVGNKTLQLLQAHNILTIQQLSQIRLDDAKNWGINNIRQIKNNACSFMSKTPTEHQPVFNNNCVRSDSVDKEIAVVQFTDHSWFNQRAYLPVITEKDTGEFATVIFCVVLKELVIENKCNLNFKVEFQRASKIQNSPLTYSAVFVASLNPNLPILHISVNRNQCDIFLVLKSVWEANVFLTMHANRR